MVTLSQVLSYYPPFTATGPAEVVGMIDNITPLVKATGPAEVVGMIDNITPLVKGASKEPTDKRKQIFDEPFHIAMDNFFSSDKV